MHKRIRRAELYEPVHITVADQRFAALLRPALGASIEIQRAGEHRVPFDGIEEIRVAVEAAVQTAPRRKEWMRRHNQALLVTPEHGQIVERADVLRPKT